MEGIPTREAVTPPTKEEVIASLRTDSEDRTLVDSYVAERQKEAATRKGELMVQLELAGIYRDAGLEEKAITLLKTAKEQANKEEEHDSYIQLMKALNALTNDPSL